MKRFDADSNKKLPAAAYATHWQARLSLGFADDGGTTRLVERSHYGPLRVQKPLYPEGEAVCHAIVVHPPGGVVGGDELTVTAAAGANASALITTPGAAKWYKANDKVSQQHVRLEVGAGGSLEWLPQETIFFDAAHVRLNHGVSLEKDATYIGGEILCFGRTASGETFSSGRIEQSTSIRREGRLVWFEQGALSGTGSSMHSPIALAGMTVCATLIAVGKTLAPSVIGSVREQGAAMTDAGAGEMFGATQMKSVFVVRYLGNSSETAKQLMTRAWQTLRPEVTGRAAVVPRIWNT
jgi:urease accessory protein